MVSATCFDGSDNEVYQESDNDTLRDDFSLSDDKNGVDEKDYDQESNEEERERNFFGDEDYTILSKMPEEDMMS